VLAGLAGEVAAAAAGMGQEYLNATILFAAAAMLGWHNVWMARHARDLKSRLGTLGDAVTAGTRPLYVLAIVVSLAVLREGSEVVLFLYGIAASGGNSGGAMLTGGAVGVAGGIAFGAALYVGLLRVPMRYLFAVTGALILLLAAGLAAQGAGYLVQADVLPPLGTALWDTSHILSERSVVGQTLHTLVGYIARPAGVQLLFYLLTLAVIGGLMRLFRPRVAKVRAVPAVLVVAVSATALALAATLKEARAGTEVFLPYVEQGEIELEYRGQLELDGAASKNKKSKHEFEIGYGITDFWFLEAGGEFEKEPGEKLNFEAIEFENVFQITQQGQYWADFGAYFAFERADDDGKPNEIKFGPIVSKSFGRVQATLNPFFAKEVGGNAEKRLEFAYGAQVKYRLMEMFEPGIEAFGEPGEISRFDRLSDQTHRLGPVAFGEFKLGEGGRYGTIAYELGVLFGLTHGSPDQTLKWMIEYEYHF